MRRVSEPAAESDPSATDIPVSDDAAPSPREVPTEGEVGGEPSSLVSAADGQASGADQSEATDSEAADTESEEDEWWQSEGMPWKQKPGRADIACLSWFGVVAVFSLVMIPLRAWLLGVAPEVYAMITGSRTAIAASGALAKVGELPSWPVVFAVASILSLKFDWIYWWAGRLWGRGMIEVWASSSKRAARNYERAERWAEKLGPIGFFVAYVPIPLPLMQVVFVLSGATGMSLKRFLIYDYLASTIWLGAYFYLGWRIGEPAVELLNIYARYALYVALGLMVIIIVGTFMRQRPAKDTSAS